MLAGWGKLNNLECYEDSSVAIINGNYLIECS